jgi:hypothetical protein
MQTLRRKRSLIHATLRPQSSKGHQGEPHVGHHAMPDVHLVVRKPQSLDQRHSPSTLDPLAPPPALAPETAALVSHSPYKTDLYNQTIALGDVSPLQEERPGRHAEMQRHRETHSKPYRVSHGQPGRESKSMHHPCPWTSRKISREGTRVRWQEGFGGQQDTGVGKNRTPSRWLGAHQL